MPPAGGRPVADGLDGRTRVTGRRIVQYVLDLLLAGALLSAIRLLAQQVAPGAGFDQAFPAQLTSLSPLVAAPGWPTIVAVTLSALIWLGVFVATPVLIGRTPAMALLGLRIVQIDGTSATGRQHVGRALVLILEGGLIGWLVIVLSRRRQRIGDHVAGTLVVRAA